MISVATWNVNSIRARMELLREWLHEEKMDIACIQETKVTDDEFPYDELKEMGYSIAAKGQKAYNGVCTLSKYSFSSVKKDFEHIERGEKRIIEVVAEGINIINAYFPHGKFPGSESFHYKIDFIEGLRDYLDKNFDFKKDKVIILGDFNVAPEELDVYDADALENTIGFHEREREALLYLKSWGFVDLFREKNNGMREYTWWDYRSASFKRNAGMRVDHIWASEKLAARCVECSINRGMRAKPKPSDHAPVKAVFEM
jgi:exodeoxyribonuclease-3